MSDVGVAALSAALALVVGLVLGVVIARARSGAPTAVDAPSGGGSGGGSGAGSGAGPAGGPTEGLSELVLERAPLAVLALDASEEVLLANRRAHELGLLDRRGAVDPLRQVARLGRTGGTTTREVSLPTVGLPRRVLQARVSAMPLPGRVTALVVEDVTEARRVDDVRRDFVANVSHEIKTPVGALRLLAEAAMESLSDAESGSGSESESGSGSGSDGASSYSDARHFVERISHESARLGRLVSELLDLSRLQGAEARPDPVPVDLDAVVSEAIDRAAPHADAKGITIVRSTPGSAVVPGVEHQLVTAVANLLDNAINYSPEATRVAVAVRAHATASGVDAWEVTVADQGLGIPEADLDRIFERFYRVDPARSRATGGTGLGLAIVKHIVRNHGGEVRVWSAAGAGSSFTLRLPTGGTSGASGPDDAGAAGDRSSPPATPAPARSPETSDDPHDPDLSDRATGVTAAEPAAAASTLTTSASRIVR